MVLLIGLLLVGSTAPASSQTACANADVRTDQGWTAYRDGDMERARAEFLAVLSGCSDHVGARTGFGYVALRTGDDDAARAAFETVLQRAPNTVDALVGLGIVAWRQGDHPRVRQSFEQVLELDPENLDAHDYLARLPPELGPPPARPPLERPDTVIYPSRVNGDYFEVRTEDGWEPFYAKGVNLGAALPGRYPSEFPDSATYAKWIEGMGEMGANTVRVYTIHPPHFYQALHAYNTANPERPLWLIHGVWTELPLDHDFEDPAWEGEFFAEMRRVVDLLHGRADIAPRPGHASGFYTADVSQWVLAYIIGREWEPYAIVGYNELRGDVQSWQGRYLRVNGGTPADAWMGKASEEIIAYEMERYHAQRPVAYTNWPTLDPLHHPTETTVDEEVAIRLELGERVEVAPLEYDNDAVGLDAMLVRATEEFPAGYFASYHAYPYYPDFMILDPEFNRAESSEGPSNYFGYLRDLKEHHAGMAVLISEYGVPASLGSAHLQPQGWHHGGVTEVQKAEIDARMTREIAEAGMAGGAVFAWIDEWFKRNWLVMDFEIPADRNRLWLNRLDAEQQYGMIAMEAAPPVAGATLLERAPSWREVEPLYTSPGGATLRAAADAAYLWLAIEGTEPAADELFIGFDMIDPEAGDFRWPGRVGAPLPAGLEFALHISGDSAQLLVDPPYNPFRIDPVGQELPYGPAPYPDIEQPLPGLFQGRLQQSYNRPFQSVANEDGRYEPLRVVTNRRRFARDGTEFPAVGYDRGRLPRGPLPDGLWERSADGSRLEMRIPWNLLNVTDPSSRRVLAENPGGGFGAVAVDGIRIVAALRTAADWIHLPESGVVDDVAVFRWSGWEEPEWVERRRPVFDTMRETFDALDISARPVEVPGPETQPEPERQPQRELQPQAEPETAPEPEPEPLHARPTPADSAWMAGDTERAAALYEAELQRDPTRSTALHRLALVRAWNERYEESLALFDRLLTMEPDNLAARVDRARVVAWSGDNVAAVAALDDLLARHPAHLPALQARAQFLSWEGEYDAALQTYGRLLDIAPDDRSTHFDRARVLAWASDFDAALAAYDSLLADDPRDVGALLARAQVLSWSGAFAAAEEAYDAVLMIEPGNLEALRGHARVAGWSGDLIEAETRWRTVLATSPDDATAHAGLAQTLRWQGRDAAALELLRTASRLAPRDTDVSEQLRLVRNALSPSVAPDFVFESDSDGNRITTTTLSGTARLIPRFELRATAYLRELGDDIADGSTSSHRTAGGAITGWWQIEPGWNASITVGGSTSEYPDADAVGAWGAAVETPGRYPVVGTLSYNRGALNSTAALLRNQVVTEEIALGMRAAPGGWRITANGALASFTGGEPRMRNQRLSASATLSRPLTPGLTLGTSVRGFAFEEDFSHGYFNPGFFGLAELVASWSGGSRRWVIGADLAPGIQQVGSGGEVRGSFRGTGRLAYVISPGRQVGISLGFANSGLERLTPGAEGDYQYRALGISARWRLR